MAFASLIHHSSFHSPLRFSARIFRAPTSFSSSIHLAFSSTGRDAFSSTSDGGRRCYCLRSHQLQCFKERSQEGGKLAEEMQINGQESCDEDSNIKHAASDISLGRRNGTTDQQSSIRIVALCVLGAVTFGIALGVKDGVDKASEYFAGYILEQSLSVDNLFVFVLIFNYFKVPTEYQSRVLSYGIAGAIIFRAIIILLGIATIQRFEVVNLLLALILLFSSYKLFSAEEGDTDLAENFIARTCQKFISVTAHYDGDQFITIEDGIWKATPLLLTVAVIELSEIAFAVDSIPAVFGVTRDPFIVFSSNLFAILVEMVVALGAAKFYGRSLPRPRFLLNDVKERVDSPAAVFDPLLCWANEAHWSMGGLSFQRHRLQGRIEGSIKKLRRVQQQHPSHRRMKNAAAKIQRSGVKKPAYLKTLNSSDESSQESSEEIAPVTPSPPPNKKKRARKLMEEFERVAATTTLRRTSPRKLKA